MKRALLFVLLSCLALPWLTGCDNTAWNPPSSQAPVAFLQSNLPQLAAQTASAPPIGSVKLMVMNADGTEQTQLDQGNFTAAHISQDGNALAVALYDSDAATMRVYTGQLGGQLMVDVTPAETWPQMPEVSPDGSKVYFTNTANIPWEIWSANSNGATPATNLNPNHDYCMHEMTVAPNGKVYFVGESDLDGKEGIFVMNSDGSNVAPVVWTDGSLSIYHPAVTSDGSKLVFEVEEGGESNIYTANIDGSNPAPITQDGASEDPLVVGDKILFVSYQNHIAQVYSMNLNGSGAAPLTDVTAANWFGDYYYENE